MRVFLNTDGGVRTGGVHGPTGGKTGLGAVGYVIRDSRDEFVLKKGGMVLDGESTVNECEYGGLLLGLFQCAELGATRVTVRMDSQLVVNQMTGEWACRQASLREHRAEVMKEVAKFESVEFLWVRREFNQHADLVTRELLDAEVAA